MTEQDRYPDDKLEGIWSFERDMSRRDLLRGAASGVVGLGALGLLTAGEGVGRAAPAGTTVSAAGSIKKGGRLRVGHVGAGKAESFNPAVGSSWVDESRYFNVFDKLTRVNPDRSQSPGLALEWNPNKDLTVWEVKLRPDVTFHNGKPFTADDVIFTIRQMAHPAHISHNSVLNVKVREVKKLNRLTLRIPLKAPDSALANQFVQGNCAIVQNGQTNFAHPIGTGPFMFDSFTVGQRSLCKRNPNYWEEGKPYVDEWEDISIDDNSARLNALLGGQIDMMSQLDFVQAKAHKATGDINVIDAPGAFIQVFTMAVDKGPFRDKRVREAFRLLPDRQTLIDRALSGFGTVGNDLAGKGLPYFDDLPVREQDLERAKSLLKAAGHEGLTVTLHTSTSTPGYVEAATLFAQQAKGAGVKVRVKTETPAAYLSVLYTHLDFAQSIWNPTSLATWYTQALLSSAVWNETHYRDRSFDKMIQAAIGSRNGRIAKKRWAAVQQIQYDRGGYIVWANQDIVDAAAKYVRGMVPSAFYNLGAFDYKNVWLDK